MCTVKPFRIRRGSHTREISLGRFFKKIQGKLGKSWKAWQIINFEVLKPKFSLIYDKKMLPNKLDFLGNVSFVLTSETLYMHDHEKPGVLETRVFVWNSTKNKLVSPEFLAGSVEFPPLPVHLDTRATEYISVVFLLCCVSRIITFMYRALLYAPFSFLVISNKFWMGGEWGGTVRRAVLNSTSAVVLLYRTGRVVQTLKPP